MLRFACHSSGQKMAPTHGTATVLICRIVMVILLFLPFEQHVVEEVYNSVESALGEALLDHDDALAQLFFGGFAVVGFLGGGRGEKGGEGEDGKVLVGYCGYWEVRRLELGVELGKAGRVRGREVLLLGGGLG